jgi:exodeoxyribonuclease VII large subunit
MTLESPVSAQAVYTVSHLNRVVRSLLEQHFSSIWLEGEVSNLSRPSSGHLYFSLKDANAQIRCVLFRNRGQLLGKSISNGQHVLVKARIGLYELRGDLQLIIDYLEETGAGALRRAFEELRQRLDQAGLFAIEHKLPLPPLASRIGVITSPSGAAIRDVLSILKRRFPALPVRIYPVPVQGDKAAEQIAQAINLASQRRDCGVLLLVRGGGSPEDLMAFNEEVVARAIHACTVPLVSGVGHEVDVTIADLVADVRAPTPSAAAELVSPDWLEWQHRFNQLETRLINVLQRRLENFQQSLAWLEQSLNRQHPKNRLQNQAQRIDELEQRLRRAIALKLERYKTQTASLANQLRLSSPTPHIQQFQARCAVLQVRLENSMQHRTKQQAQRLTHAGQALHAVSPLHTLKRGYAIVRHYPEGEIIRQADQAKPGDDVEALLHEGRLICKVEKTQ